MRHRRWHATTNDFKRDTQLMKTAKRNEIRTILGNGGGDVSWRVLRVRIAMLTHWPLWYVDYLRHNKPRELMDYADVNDGITAARNDASRRRTA